MAIGKLALWTGGVYQKDAIFDASSALNRDNCLAPQRALKESLNKRGWECHTQDVYREAGIAPDVVLFLDIPAEPVERLLKGWAPGARKWVVLQECAAIIPRNWDLDLHKQFEHIFTWNEELVDNRKYFKINFSNSFPVELPEVYSPRERFCVLIAAQHKLSHPLELYSKRVEAIRWFERNHPEEFDLYGMGWDKYIFSGPKYVRLFNRFPSLCRALAPKFPAYKGPLASKRSALAKYKFSICYENAQKIPGYITEKIFDCFFAGTVPVYWGAPDIDRYVPEECYIDRRKFASYEDLYDYMKAMTQGELTLRAAAMRAFVLGPGPYQFSDRYYGETIAARVEHG